MRIMAAEAAVLKKLRSKRLLLMLIAALLVTAGTIVCGTKDASAAVTDAKTPAGAYNAHIKWQKRFGTGYANAVTPPLIIGDDMYIGSGGVVYKLNKNTGEVRTKLTVEGVFGYTTITPSWDGKDRIFIPLSNGRIEAIDISGSNMKKVWTSASFGEQAIVPLKCANGKIYTGTYGTKNSYVCIDQKTGAVTKLATNSNKGFYWSGAYADEKAVVFGEEADKNGESVVRSLEAVSSVSGGTSDVHNIISSKTVKGSVRSTIVRGGDHLFFVSKAKLFYKIGYDAGTGELGSVKSVDISGESTGVPVIYGGRAYVGTSAGKVDVIDTTEMKKLYSVATPGYVQGEMLISTGNSGKLCLYAACNTSLGQLYYIEPGETKAAAVGTLLEPDFEQYCISPVICDDEGTIFYKNDSGYIMAVAGGYDLRKPSVSIEKTTVRSAGLNIRRNNGAVMEIWRSTSASGGYQKAGETKSRSYTDGKVQGGRYYYYKVRAKIAGKYSAYSEVKAAVTKLAAPKVKKASAKKIKKKKAGVIVKWSKAEFATGYEIYRSKKKSGSYKKLKVLNGSKVKYTDKKVKKKSKYYYKVKAFRSTNGKKVFSTFSNIKSVRIK